MKVRKDTVIIFMMMNMALLVLLVLYIAFGDDFMKWGSDCAIDIRTEQECFETVSISDGGVDKSETNEWNSRYDNVICDW